jgi:tetratricopeptide (TPR) repeat protein
MLKLVRSKAPRWVVPAVALPVVLLLAARTVRRNADWRDEFTLALSTLRASPSSPLMNDIAGVEFARHNDIGHALPLFAEATRQAPYIVLYHIHLGTAYYVRGRLDEAVTELKAAINAPPDAADDDAHNDLGLVYLAKGDSSAAVTEFRASLQLDPQRADTRGNLGAVYLGQGRLDSAAAELTTAVRLDPESAEAHNNVGAVYRARGQLGAAALEFREAIRLKPDFSMARANLATVETRIAAKH